MSTRVTGTMRILGRQAAAISQGSRARSYQSCRTCVHRACDTILSVYNPSTYCSVHEKLALDSRKRGIPRPPREVVCENCATGFETTNPARKYCSDRCRMAAFARRKRAAMRAESRQQQAHGLPAMVPGPDESEPVMSAA